MRHPVVCCRIAFFCTCRNLVIALHTWLFSCLPFDFLVSSWFLHLNRPSISEMEGLLFFYVLEKYVEMFFKKPKCECGSSVEVNQGTRWGQFFPTDRHSPGVPHFLGNL